MNVNPVFETPYERAGVITPGLPILPHGTERHPVPGGGSRAVPVFQGDEISVLDRQGLQPGELVFFAPDGSSDVGKIGATSDGKPEGLMQVLLQGTVSGKRVAAALDKAGFDLDKAQSARIFPNGSRPGDMATFHVEC
ncbi:MAG: aminomethyltransferase, partial [Pseudomonadota bacterium]